jgi:hypothetical protein
MRRGHCLHLLRPVGGGDGGPGSAVLLRKSTVYIMHIAIWRTAPTVYIQLLTLCVTC